MFLILATLWGTSFVAIEVGLHHFPPILFAALRYDVAGLIVLGYALYSTDRWRPRERDEWLQTAVTAVFVFAAYHALLYIGEQHISGAVAAVVISLSPILTAGFGSVLKVDDPLQPLGAIGFLCGIAGVVVVVQPEPGTALSTSLIGVLLVFIAGTSFALGTVLTRPLDSGLPVQTMEGWSMLLGAGLLHVVSFGRGESFAAIEWTGPAVVSLTYLTLVSGVVAFLLYFELLDRLGPTEINLVGYLEPVVATVATWLLFGDLVDSTTLFGFTIIFAGFALIKRHALSGYLRRRLSTDRLP
ncbi:DMT family transporter [Haloarchaeobius sp. HME9146]|uniref:DMT family transporter n=1 Tax=Haloarchaeobius sp. HME9146 TaxID=2978732 RepID=UPI0021C05E4F|nr:DMT family transporter [Haloarchaeobius sp. HME9146]MCT9096158.1 DMT family transporter [Haloarchaeobius sp. HME9146]